MRKAKSESKKVKNERDPTKQSEKSSLADSERKQVEDALRESEKRLKESQEIAQLGQWDLDLVTNKLNWSEGIYNLFGIKPDEFDATYEAFLDAIHPDDKEFVNKAYTDSVKNKSPYNITHRLKLKDGTVKYVNEICRTEYDESGKPLRSIGTIQDITELKQTEEELRKSEIRFRSLIEQTSDSVFCYEYDPPISTKLPLKEQIKKLYQGVLVECNDVCARSYGANKAKEVIGKKLTDLFGTTPDSLDELYKAFIKNGYRTVDEEGVEVLPDGSSRYYLNNGYGIVENGKLLRIWGTFRDITARKLAEEKLRHSEEKFREIVENINDVIYRVDKNGMVNYVSPSIKGFLGYTPSEIIGQPFRDFIYEKDLPRLMKNVQKILTGEKADNEYRILTKSGDIRWIHTSSRPIKIEDEVIGLQGVLSDITERKAAEEALRDSEQKWRAIVQNTPDIILNLDLDGKILFINHTESGYKIEDVNGKSVYDFIPPEQHKKTKESIKKVIKTGKPVSYETSVIASDGSTNWYSTRMGPIKQDNKIVGLAQISTNVTDQKRAEEQTRMQRDLGQALNAMTNLDEAWEACVETAINTSGMDSGGVYLVNNNTGDLDLVYSKGLSQKFVKAASHYNAKSPNVQLVMSGKSTYVLYPELKLSPDAKRIPEGLHALAVVPVIHEDNVIGCLNIASHTLDEIPITTRNTLESIAAQIGSAITRIQAREDLKRSEEWFRSLIENSASVYSVMDKDGIAKYQSPSLERNYGWTPEEVKGKPIFNRIHPDDLPRINKTFGELLKNSGSVRIEEVRYKHKDGSWRYIEAIGANYLDNPAIGGIMINSHDITERKMAEEALRFSEEKFSKSFQSSPNLMALFDMNSNRILEVNDSMTKITGYKREQIIGKKISDPGFLIEKIESKRIINLLKKKSSIKDAEIDIQKKTGEIRHLSVSGETFEAGGNRYAIISALDITKRKEAEAALRVSEEKYRELVENINDVIYFVDKQGITQYMSPAVERATGGFKPSDLEGHKYDQYLHPDDVEWVNKEFKVRLSGKSGTAEYRTNTKTGEVLWLRDSSRPVIKNGQVVGVQGVLRDITEYKKAEQKLRVLSSAVEQSVLPFALINKNGILEYMNPKLLKAVNMTAKQAIGKPWRSFLSKHTTLKVHMPNIIETVMNKGRMWQGEITDRTKDGKKIWRDAKVFPIKDEHDKISHIVYSSEDITERKAAEEALKFQALLLDQSSEFIIASDLNGRISYSNAAMGSALGIDPNELIGQSVQMFPDEEGGTNNLDIIEDTINKGQWFGERQMEFKDGTRRIIELHTQLLHDHDGEPNALFAIGRDITERKLAEDALKESEEKFRGIAEGSFDMIFMVDIEGKFTYVSPAAERILGYNHKLVLGKRLKDFIPEDEIPKMYQVQAEFLKGEPIQGFEMRLQSKNGSIIHFEANVNPIFKDNILIGFQGIARDITDRKHAEEEMKKRLMKFRLEEGDLYLVQEDSPTLSLEAYKELLKVGYNGIVISRTPVNELRNKLKGNIEFHWLSEKKSENTMPPILKNIENFLDKLPKKRIIFIERLDYLISKHGFKKVLNFIHQLKELAVISNHVIITSIDPSIISSTELRLLEKESSIIELQRISKLPEHLLEILKFAHQQNLIGIKPSHSDICRDLKISKPTARKRIRQLTTAGYIIEGLKGRNKVLELTEQGRNIFS